VIPGLKLSSLQSIKLFFDVLADARQLVQSVTVTRFKVRLFGVVFWLRNFDVFPATLVNKLVHGVYGLTKFEVGTLIDDLVDGVGLKVYLSVF
jgi:hypothetical protein